MVRKSSRRLIEINGSYGEGGGQLVRLAVGLSALSRRPISIEGIRGGRPGGGGLKGQHLHAMEFLARACGANVSGAKLRSQTLTFEPAMESSSTWWKPAKMMDGSDVRSVKIDQETPGAIALVLQAVLPFLLFSPVASGTSTPNPILLTIEGGTHVSFSPSLSYVEHVFLPNLKLCGLPRIELLPNSKQCWSDARSDSKSSLGSASFLVTSLKHSDRLKNFSHKLRQVRGKVKRLLICTIEAAYGKDELFSAICEAISKEAEHFDACCKGHGTESLFNEAEIEWVQNEKSTRDRKMYVLLVAETESGWRLGKDILWEGNKKATRPPPGILARQIVSALVEELGNATWSDDGSWSGLDSYMVDQITVYQALASKSVANTMEEETRTVEAEAKDIEGITQGLEGIELSRNRVDSNVDIDNNERREGLSLHTLTARWMCEEILGVKFDEHGFCDGSEHISGS